MGPEAAREPQRVPLPGGPVIWATSPAEAQLLWRSITPASGYHEAAARLRPDDVLLDIGANVGLTAIYCARLQPRLRVIAVEPAPEVFACLDRNAAEHLGRSHTVCAAVWDRPGERPFTYYPNAPGNSSLLADPARDDEITRRFLMNTGFDADTASMLILGLHDGVTLTVPTITVSGLIQQFELPGIALLKIDVEGAELEVLSGIDAADWGGIGEVVAEVYDDSGRLDAVCSLLRGQGFDVATHQEPALTGTGMFEVRAVSRHA